MAGICCSIVIMNANAVMAELHDRMQVILEQGVWPMVASGWRRSQYTSETG
jgi:putative SOS response-associated peptidase YedK